MDIYSYNDVVPLSYSRIRNGTLVSGLIVSVAVTNSRTNATLLPSTPCPESQAGSGFYFYNWAHGLVQDTQLTVTYTVKINASDVGQRYIETIFISGSTPGGRAS